MGRSAIPEYGPCADKVEARRPRLESAEEGGHQGSFLPQAKKEKRLEYMHRLLSHPYTHVIEPVFSLTISRT